MCGRYSITTPVEALRRLFDLAGPMPNLAARYNVAPSQDVPVVRDERDGAASTGNSGDRRLVHLRWGLVPFWAKELSIGYRMINARAETVAEKPAFRAALKSRRCLIPTDGFYEWQRRGKTKQPYRFQCADDAAFALAGLWERWIGPEDAIIESCAILTTTANDVVARIHHRMPVILSPTDCDAWLDVEGCPPADATALLRPYPAAEMKSYPVSTRVNSPKHDDPECATPLEEEQRLL